MATEQQKFAQRQALKQAVIDEQKKRSGQNRLSAEVHASKRIYLERTTSQSMSNAGNHTISWNSEVEDGLGWFEPAVDDRFIIPTEDAWIMVICASAWHSNATNTRNLSIYKNSSKYYEEVFPATAQDPYGRGSITVVMHVTPPDYLEVVVYQDSGGSLNFGSGTSGVQTPFLYIQKVS